MTTQKFNKIDVSKLSVGKIKNSTNMRTFFIDYNNELFSVQTPELMLDWGGVPKVDEYHITEADRRYVQYGTEPQSASKTRELDEDHKKRINNLRNFEKFLLSLEEWVNSDPVQKKLFEQEGKTRSADFISLVKSGSGDRPNNVKFKFYADKETGAPDFELSTVNPDSKQREYKLTDGMSLEDLRKSVFKYMGKQRLIFQIRGWTDKLTKKAPRFGLTLTIKCVEYSLPVPKSKTPVAQTTFIDSSDEEEDDEEE